MRLHDLFRASGDISKPLTEAPELIGPTQFGLTHIDVNRATLKQIMKLPYVVLDDQDKFQLIRTGSSEGAIVLYNKEDQLIAYYIRYETEQNPLVGETVTQVALWRKSVAGAGGGFASKVFFDYLLVEWPAVMSDRVQTEDGMRFWRDRIADANTAGHRVSLADFKDNKIEHFGGGSSERLIEWMDSFDAWRWNAAAQDLRYIIYRK